MAQIYNSDLTKGIQENAKIQISRDAVPNQLAEKVVPTMETNPRLLRYTTITKASELNTSGSGTLYTTPADKEFYMTGVSLGFSKDAACDLATGVVRITAYVNGALTGIIGIGSITLTAQSASISLSFNPPLKVDKNTAIAMGGTYTAGLMSRAGYIHGYLIDNITS